MDCRWVGKARVCGMKSEKGFSRTRRLGRFAFILLALGIFVSIGLAGWVIRGDWPSPVRGELPWKPDAILVLGGGNIERPNEAMRLAKKFPKTPVIVTGDGGLIVDKLVLAGLPNERIIHETRATSTMENAQFSRDVLNQLQASRVVIVTNWFHAPRAAAIFEKVQSDREFFLSFSPKPEKLDNWNAYGARRERLAVLHNLIRHRIWSF